MTVPTTPVLRARGGRHAALLCSVLLLWVLTGMASAQSDPAATREPWTAAALTDRTLAFDADHAALQRALEAAARDLDRARRDPLATELERRVAADALAAATEALAAHERALAREVAVALDALATAEAELAAAAGRLEVAERQLEVARVRHEAGTATDADLAKTDGDVATAGRRVRDAGVDLDLAWEELAVRTGLALEALTGAGVDAASIPTPEALPDLAAVLADLDATHAGIAAAARALDLARVRLAGSDHEGSTPNAIADARQTVADAERRLEDVRRAAEARVRAAHRTWTAALERLADARDDHDATATTLAAQRVRFEAGELTPIAWRQAQLEAEASDAAVAAATRGVGLTAAAFTQAVAGD